MACYACLRMRTSKKTAKQAPRARNTILRIYQPCASNRNERYVLALLLVASIAIDTELTIVVGIYNDNKVGETDGCHDNAIVKQIKPPYLDEDGLEVLRSLVHSILIGGFQAECESWWTCTKCVEPKGSDRAEWEGGFGVGITEC